MNHRSRERTCHWDTTEHTPKQVRYTLINICTNINKINIKNNWLNQNSNVSLFVVAEYPCSYEPYLYLLGRSWAISYWLSCIHLLYMGCQLLAHLNLVFMYFTWAISSWLSCIHVLYLNYQLLTLLNLVFMYFTWAISSWLHWTLYPCTLPKLSAPGSSEPRPAYMYASIYRSLLFWSSVHVTLLLCGLRSCYISVDPRHFKEISKTSA